MHRKSTFHSFNASPYFSIKHTNYFHIYDKLLSKYIGERITFVEIGILDGGSLFMWRDFLGEGARIIGVDLNPEAVKWREHGFEIFIGDQSKPEFWRDLFNQIGSVHILLDDGGHRNDQQIVTATCALPHILDGGLIIIEDTQTSFMKFESFSKYTFVSFLQNRIESLYARSDELKLHRDIFSKSVHSIEFFTGVCALHIDRTQCESTRRIENGGIKNYSSDFRYNNDSKLLNFLRSTYNWISWDYASQERIRSHPRIIKTTEVRLIRLLLRVFIVPCRFIIYFLLKSCNLNQLKRLLKVDKVD